MFKIQQSVIKSGFVLIILYSLAVNAYFSEKKAFSKLHIKIF